MEDGPSGKNIMNAVFHVEEEWNTEQEDVLTHVHHTEVPIAQGCLHSQKYVIQIRAVSY